MKVCFIGIGSIGKRHLQNLITCCNENGHSLEIHALRSNRNGKQLPTSFEQYIKRHAYAIDELDSHYDAIFITNPTDYHYETLINVANKSQYIFIEKPIFNTLDVDISKIPFKKDTVCYVAAPLRYCGVLQRLFEIVSPDDVYCARVICSSFLPDWRPDVDYRTIYSANKDAGGGVCIDLIHEWDYLHHFFGHPKKTHMLYGKVSDLEINSEDLAIYIAQYDNKLVEVHLDYFGRQTKRSIELFTKNGTICGDIANARITFTDGTAPIEFNEDRNTMYLREMNYFLSLVLNQQNTSTNNIEHAMQILSIVIPEERSEV